MKEGAQMPVSAQQIIDANEVLYNVTSHGNDYYGASTIQNNIEDVMKIYASQEVSIALAEKENKVTRVECIDENGRSYVNWDDKNKIELSYQDNGKTLKIFITKQP